MSNAHSRRAPVSGRVVIFAALAAIVLPVHTASAQLGGLVRRARDKAIEQQVDKQVEKRTGSATDASAGAPPKFDDITVELTEDRIAGILRGLNAGRAVLDGTNGGPSRASLVARRDAAANKRVSLSDANAKVISAYEVKRDESTRCRNEAIRVSREANQQKADKVNKELQQKALTDPAYREKVMASMQKLTAAQQKGDTAEMNRIYAELGLTAVDPKADSLAADKACGKAPPKPAVLVEMDRLNAEADALSEQIRKLEETAAATEIKESGLTARQFNMARERIEAYLSAMKYNGKPRGYSAGELNALGAHRADLEKVM